MRAPLALAAALLLASCRATAPAPDLSDAAVEARIEAVLRGRKDLDLRYVAWDVNGRVATLSGLCADMEQLREIARLVRRVPGVEQAVVNLAVGE